jgi:predicted alpha/beta-hydrolase family hydrolase
MASPEARGRLDVANTDVETAWIRPPTPVATLVVAHGAGAGIDHPFMAGFCRAIADAKVATMRFNFPYIERGRRSPDPERVLRETWLAAFDAANAKARGGPVLAGGKSLGGRIASMCVADGMPAAGLLFMGYPLHPPGKPVLTRVLRKLGDRATLIAVEGGDHSFNVRGRKADARDVGAGLAELAAPFVERVARAHSSKAGARSR